MPPQDNSAARVAARSLIEQIVRDNGFVREGSLESMKPDVRREVEEALLAKDKKIGASVLTLAKNLYTSNARFVFELLQNADDNQYSVAAARGQKPFVSFKLYPQKLVVECNEDGFTEANLRAICDIGNSSKNASQGYIGEKGIGFKSVFMAAWKVRIQSGHFSFCFVHRKGDSGMGMVQPVWEEPDDNSPPEHTRFTLFFHDEMTGGLDAIKQQFREIQPAVLLFLRKLRRVDVTFYDGQGSVEWNANISMRDGTGANRTEIQSIVLGSAPKTQIYHVTKYMATDLEKSENRMLSPAEEATKSYSRSEIVLAFPITPDLVPIIEAQKVFAFLPLRQMGFNFLIQADFVTQANREDIVTSSIRNIGLRRCLVAAMIKAIGQLCQSSGLQWTWMRFMPTEGSYHWDPFWKPFISDIKQNLQHKPLLRTLETNQLGSISTLRRSPNDCVDSAGHPLFSDLRPELYISHSYSLSDLNLLSNLGLSFLSRQQVVALLTQDLKRNDSRWKAPPDEDWNTRASTLLSHCASSQSCVSSLLQLQVIQLNTGAWVSPAKRSASFGSVYYGNIGDVHIPVDLGLSLLKPSEPQNAARREFFDIMGVKTASVSQVRSLILRYCSSAFTPEIKESAEHLRFLYLTSSLPEAQEDLASKSIPIINHLGEGVRPNSSDLYVQTEEPYQAFDLLGNEGALACNVSFVHQYYFEDPPEKSESVKLTWKDWLHEVLGVKRYIPLVGNSGAMSKECNYIAKHNRDKFLGFLKSIWPSQGQEIMRLPKVLQALKTVEVCCEGFAKPLSETYLPFPTLRDFCEKFNVEKFPFVTLPGETAEHNLHTSWSFLTSSGLIGGQQVNLAFKLSVLQCIKPARFRIRNVMTLYHSIQASCVEEKNFDAKAVRDLFEKHELVLILSTIEDECWSWDSPSRCLWEAPAGTTRHGLKIEYAQAVANTNVDVASLESFFKRTLCVKNIDEEVALTELKSQRDYGGSNPVLIRELYQLLFRFYKDKPSIGNIIRDAFAENALIYVPNQGPTDWYTPTQCVWSNGTRIEGKVSIDDHYGDLKKLFTGPLGVATLQLQMVFESLIDISSKNPTVQKVKELLRSLNSFLTSEKKTFPPDRMLEKPLFPVRSPDGQVKLCNAEDDFFIIDREEPFEMFQDRISFLDFDMREVCQLRPFFQWTGIESRYVSRCIEQTSRVGEGTETPVSDRNRDLKTKSYGLLRCAAKYNSPRFVADAEGLYNLLRRAITVETDGISSYVSLKQGGRSYEHEVSTSELHIEDKDDMLKIYVPRDEVRQDVCFQSRLPRYLVSWFMTVPGASAARNTHDDAVHVTNSVLNCRASAVANILREEGVPSIDITEIEITPPMIAEIAQVEVEAGMPQVEQAVTPIRPTEMSFGFDSASSSISERLPDVFTPITGMDAATPLTTPGGYFSGGQSIRRHWSGPPIPSTTLRPQDFENSYKDLLERVIQRAKTLSFPYCVSEDWEAAFGKLSLADDVFSDPVTPCFSSESDRRVKIGAAGELFAFEMLSRLALADFNRDNWQSVIRHHCSVHTAYAGMLRFVGRETSDIVYDDVSGTFTKQLISLGYLTLSRWAGRKPKYYIEVKSTMDHSEVPFFVSEGQYERIRTTTNGPLETGQQDEVYLLFRCFKLGTKDAGLKIYADPEELRRLGKLKFSTEKYSVVPTAY
ncbi:hypothetical protein S7711_09101 [Stachybotrys chartarum IBT 7711]|uniref:Protein NO VEIN C-terminal domain-containing protein n=1 Tax=Stachybotrys chartarum (strain CBS 109288 / IBT 7711) TaxID=1280523 RepID=A0A084ASA9_STACB|nr:hypothetical protein S7711_09101 [Stachybotrys chartarum IBT 7711]